MSATWTPDEWTFLLGVASSSEALQNFRRSCSLYLLDRIEAHDEDGASTIPPMAFAARFIGEYNAFQRAERARQVICPSQTKARLRFVHHLSSRGVIVHTPNRLIEYMRSLGLVLYFTACATRPWLLGIEFYINPHDEDYAFPFLPPLPFGVNRHWTLAQLEAHFGAADSTVYRRENLELVVAWKNVLGNFQAHVAIRLDERTR